MHSAHRRVEMPMIKLTRLNHIPMILNSDLIEHIDMAPDTIVTLTSGQKYTVLETAEEVVERVIGFRQMLNHPDPRKLTEPRSSDGLSELESPTHGR